jgi:hypothetical protein
MRAQCPRRINIHLKIGLIGKVDEANCRWQRFAVDRGELGKIDRAPVLFLQSARIAKALPTARPIHTFAPGGLGIFDADIPGGTQSGSGPKGRPDCFF